MENTKTCCCNSEDRVKATPRSEAQIKAIKSRINRIVGQLQGISKMIEEQRYCGDVLIQMSAAQNALKSVSYEILKEHLSSCVASEIKQGNMDIIDETIDVIKKL
jgi:DNA-binding FrmR family transcriptional regulator